MPQPTIDLRPATVSDAPRLAGLWVAVFPDKFGPILGRQSEAVLADWLRLSYRSLRATTLAQIERQTVGFISLAPPGPAPPGEGRRLWYALQRHNGLLGTLRGWLLLGLLHQERPPQPDQLYIEMLGVAPAWQGRGVARCLLAHAEAEARRRRAVCLALSVVIDNRPAVRLYARCGFKIRAERRSRLLRWITHHPGYYEMTKCL